ncbi:uncharacterized protein LOC131298536 [Rhododendron vialii]|uniref:uncharacterized protein LOC131298536 n=1 Tax=Rhododendron vialii TaxID=182163 RepID=UPI00265DE97E|nr:uncharacterized protein LOC131298536 [Rhododendron vialii]
MVINVESKKCKLKEKLTLYDDPQGWYNLIAPGPVRAIFMQTLSDQIQKCWQLRGGQDHIPFDNIFLGMSILCKNIAGHLSTHVVGQLDDMEAIKIVDGIFYCGCSILQTVLGYHLGKWQQELSFGLSTSAVKHTSS